MTSKEHKKHGKTVKAKFGNFGRLEIAIMGTPCGEIKKIAKELINRLEGFKIAYVDADHKTEQEDVPAHMQSGGELIYTDKIKFNRLDFSGSFDRFDKNWIFNEYDLVLVNGNHFEADLQLLIIDERKPLEKKLDKIKNPIAIIRESDEIRLPDYLENHLGKELEIQPLYSLDQLDRLADLIRDSILMNVPPLSGLVLAGGKSMRMGQDKGLMEYHDLPQREHVFHLLKKFTDHVFISCRPEQQEEFEGKFATIHDSISGLGPFGALVSAFREHPNHAWLVVACDVPLVNELTISELLQGRNPSKIATSFYNSETDFPDPLVTIWEPKAYPRLLHFLSLGYSCPRKVLINSNTEVLTPSNPDFLLNANNPEEYDHVKQMLKNAVKS